MIKKGNISNINTYRQWFLGRFVKEPDLNTKNSRDFEVKWCKRKKGHIRPPVEKVVADKTCISLIICVYGKCKFVLVNDNGDSGEYLLENEGDYVYWTPDMKHLVEVLEDTLMIAIRWYTRKD